MWSDRNSGRMTMLDDPGEVLGASLKRLGYSLNSMDGTELREAQREAIAQKRLLRAYLNAEVRDQAVAGDVLMAQLWATSAEQAIAEAPHLAFVYPAEGFALYADNAVILRESRRQELAHAFIDYLAASNGGSGNRARNHDCNSERGCPGTLAGDGRGKPDHLSSARRPCTR